MVLKYGGGNIKKQMKREIRSQSEYMIRITKLNKT